MKLARATLARVQGDLGRSVGSRAHPLAERAGLLLHLVDAQGTVGQGEAAPLPGYSRDTLEEAAAELGAIDAPRLPALDLDAPLPEQLAQLLDRAGVRAPSARFAVETALLDLAGQRLGRPLAQLLGDAPPRPQLPLNAVLDGDTPAALVASAERAVARGLHTLKVKVGRPGAFPSELAGLAAVRDALGSAVALRVDANQAFSRAEVRERLAALAPLRPELVEEPLAGGLLDAPADLLAELGALVPLGADESLQAPDGLARLAPLLAAGRLRALVLKPMALGGLGACLALGRAAAAAGVALVVTHLWDGPVALAAAAALALALPGELLASGLDRHPGLDAWPPVTLPGFGDAAVRPSTRPGLGLPLLALP